MSARCSRLSSQTVSTPAIAEPATLPTAPIANATSIETTPMETATMRLGEDHPAPVRDQRERRQPAALAPLAGDREDRDDRQDHRHREADRGREGAVGQLVVGRPEQDRAGGQHRGDADAGQQPEARTGCRRTCAARRRRSATAGSAGARRAGRRDGAGAPGCRGGLVRSCAGGEGGHAAAPSRWVSAVSSRNISSSPAPSAARSSSERDAGRVGDLADQLRVGLDAQGVGAAGGGAAAEGEAGGGEGAGQVVDVGGADQGPGGLEQLGLGALGDDPAAVR